MEITTIAQPERQLGREISELLDSGTNYTKIVLVSAFVSLRTILRLRDRLQHHAEGGTILRFTVGIDLDGTSREVLEELVRWKCEAFVFHNTIARATFHPKIYLFESTTSATLYVGSNNLTDGGFYTNYEAAIRYDFNLPIESAEYERVLAPLRNFLDPQGETVRALSNDLIRLLVARGDVPSDAQVQQRKREQRRREDDAHIPESPFAPVATPLPPLLSQGLRPTGQPGSWPSSDQVEAQEPRAAAATPAGILVWRKTLPRSDALQVNEGSAHVGGVRLTQAKFENPPGSRIDQTTYFRRLFADYYWEPETGRRRNSDQEHAFVPMRLFIRGIDYGIHNFEISHKPSGEAEQANYTTILRWGRDLNPVVQSEGLTGAIFSLYEAGEGDAPFFIDITQA